MSKLRPALNDIEALLSHSVREQMLEDIAANDGGEVLWWGKLAALDSKHGAASREPGEVQTDQVGFVEAAACGNEESVLAHFPYMERGDVVLHNHPSGGVQPSTADMAVSGELAMQGIGFYIVDNRLSRICVVARPVQEAREQPLDPDQLSALLGPEGPFARSTARATEAGHGEGRTEGGGLEYELRPAQQALLRQVASALNEGKIAVAEGGTGIGKSFAYLLPAAFWALRNKQRVLISTATINLQQQLIEKDIPQICRIEGLQELRAELVKGRGNYLCLWRLKQTREEEAGKLGLSSAEAQEDGQVRSGEDRAELFAAELASIEQWATLSRDGSLSDLGFRPRSAVWHQVCGESDNCLGLRCAFHEKCFIIQARRRAAAAHILVVNHHLLFADLELRAGGNFGYEKAAVLPPYRHVVLDEAHNIERSAQSFFSAVLSRYSAQRSLRRLYSKQRGRERGLWVRLRRYAELESEELPDITTLSEALQQSLEGLDATARQVWEAGPGGADSAASLRIPPQCQDLSAELQSALREQLEPQLRGIHIAFQALLRAQRQIYELLDDVLEGDEQQLLLEWRQLSRRLDVLSDGVRHWLDYLGVESAGEAVPGPERVFWLERRRRGGAESQDYTRLVCTQINIGELMQRVLYQPMRSSILLSATLTVRGRFDYWFSRVGLSELAAEEQDACPPDSGDLEPLAADVEMERGALSAAVYTSPFDYRARVHLLLATDAPSPSAASDFDSYVAHFSQQALEAMGGRSLLLFTSYAALNHCHRFLEQQGGSLGLLRQGEDDSARLLQRFKEEVQLSLLATDSFWEGVDAPGATLAQVLLCRLPFRSPRDPIVAAHTECLERRGENAFFRYSLPEAILRFRQGFGRLMRRGSDRGIVVVLDPRINSKRYGRDFLESLPPVRIVRGDFASLQRYISDYAEEQSF